MHATLRASRIRQTAARQFKTFRGVIQAANRAGERVHHLCYLLHVDDIFGLLSARLDDLRAPGNL